MEKKKIIIIGGGIAGLSAGIYALDNNFDVTIYEKHKIVGGQCTGWVRDGVFIDGCAHWVIGTNPNSDLYPLWRHVGAIDATSRIYNTEYFCKYDIDGETFTFYADLEKLKNEMLCVAPEDKKQIRRFINGVRAYEYVRIPTKKPLDYMNIFEFLVYGIRLLPMAIRFYFYQRLSIKEYSDLFKSKILKEAFIRAMDEKYNVHSWFYIMQALSKKDAGVPEGGSMKLAMNMKENYLSLGGKLICNQEIDHILIEDDVAKGVVFKDGSIEYADDIIATTDAYHTMNQLLQGKYKDKYYGKRFENRKDNPLQTSLLISFKLKKSMSDYAKMQNFDITPFTIADTTFTNISVRNHSFDETLNARHSTMTVLMNVNDGVYDYYKSLSKDQYKKEKLNIGNHILNEIKRYYNLNDDDIKLIDVATPLTYERYTNAYRGSYMSFITTNKARGLMRKGSIKQIKHFAMAGQWIMPPGGLPIALFTGKHSIIRICRMEKVRFVDKDMNKLDILLERMSILTEETI